MLYEESFLDKVAFGTKLYTDFQGGGSDVKECVAGFPALKHLSVPLGLVLRTFPSSGLINGDAIMSVIDAEKYDTLYEKILDTHKGRKTRREARPITNKRRTQRTYGS